MAFTEREVNIELLKPDGSPHSGKVRFSAEIPAGTGGTIIYFAKDVVLDEEGQGAVALRVYDDGETAVRYKCIFPFTATSDQNRLEFYFNLVSGSAVTLDVLMNLADTNTVTNALLTAIDDAVAAGLESVDADFEAVEESISALQTGKQDALGYVPVPNSRTVNGLPLTDNIVLTKTEIGLGNVPNTDATVRSNHTGQQEAATISDFNSAALAAAPAETATSVGGLINGAAEKTTPVNADKIPLADSAASNILKWLSFTNLKAFLKTYFDTLYQVVLASGTNIKTVNGASLLGSGDLTISTTADASALGYKDAELTADCIYHQGTATVAKNATTLTVTGAGFVVGDVGKEINISRYRHVQDAGMTATSNVVTSATAAFTADDDGATVIVAGAGAAGVALVGIAVYVNSTTVNLTTNGSTALNASTTVAAAGIGIYAVHHTTIASRTSATVVELTAAPTVGFTNSTVIYGTDQRANLATAGAAAVGAAQPLFLKSGKYFVKLTSANPYAIVATSSNFQLIGGGREQTEVVLVYAAIPSFDGGLLQSNHHTFLSDLTAKYLGPPATASFYIDSPSLVTSSQTGTSNSLTVSRVTAVDVGSGANISSSSSNPSRLYIRDCDFMVWYGANNHFRSTGGTTDHENHVQRSVLKTKYPLRSMSNDSDFNPHINYIHPHVTVLWDACEMWTENAASQSPYILHHFGTAIDIPKNPISSINNCRFSGAGYGLFTASLATAVGKHIFSITNCSFNLSAKVPITLNGPGVIKNNTFNGASGQIQILAGAAIGAGEIVIDGNNFQQMIGTPFSANTAGTVWKFQNNYVESALTASGSVAMVAVAAVALYVDVEGNTFHGVASNRGYVYNARRNLVSARFIRNRVTGDWITSKVFGNSTITGDDQTRIEISENEFLQTGATWVGNIASDNGNVFGRGNYFSPTASPSALPQFPSGDSASLVPPAKRSGTALTIASNLLSPDFNHDTFTVTGGGTANNIYVGGLVAVNRGRGGDLILIASGASFILAHNAGGTGNIRAKALANRTVADGEAIRLRADERAGLWYEV